MEDAGVLIDCGPLYPVTSSTTVRVRGGETLLTDGPAAEIKEHFGGFTLIECADLDEALKWAERIPTAHDGSVEVRPVIGVQQPDQAPAEPEVPGWTSNSTSCSAPTGGPRWPPSPVSWATLS